MGSCPMSGTKLKTGAFDMPMADYLSAYGVSQSQLKLLGRSPAHFKYAQEHPEPSTPAQILGTILDTAIFSGDGRDFETCCHVQPNKYPSKEGDKPWHNGATFCKTWTAERQDKPIISSADYSSVLLMRDSVFAHPAAALVLKQGGGKSLFWEDADTGLQCRARPDWMSGTVIADLKSCIDASPEGFARAVAKFGYDVQAAWYLDGANVLGLQKEHFFFIAAESEAPYSVAVYELDEASIAVGRSKYRRLLNRYQQCVIEDRWPAYSQHVEVLSLPSWNFKAEQNAIALADSPRSPALEVGS